MKPLRHREDTESGQVALVLAFILAGLVFLFLLVTDIYLSVKSKNRLQNAGDAAALAAARWQGITLNLVGELNLLHLAAACQTNLDAVAGILALQERLAVAGPLAGFLAANETAVRNGAPVDDDMTEIVAQAMRQADGRSSPTWPSKGADYAAMLGAILAQGIAAGADNARLLPAAAAEGGHPLYDRLFYAAAGAKNWPAICRRVFSGNHAKAAATLSSWPGWGNVPDAATGDDMVNSEFFGVGLRRCACSFIAAEGQAAADELLAAADAAGLGAIVTKEALDASRVLDDESFPWYFYDTSLWRGWNELDRGGKSRFPLMGDVKPCYNVLGAVAACRVRNVLPSVTGTSETNAFAWTAAAKPFGDNEGRRVIDVLPDAPLVLPSFHFVRLVPLGGAGESNLGAADLDWLGHVRSHVPQNVRSPVCPYCGILDEWERPESLREGGEYLMSHPHDEVCEPPAHGLGEGGGTHHAH